MFTPWLTTLQARFREQGIDPSIHDCLDRYRAIMKKSEEKEKE
jgi:hypothetical protein